MAGIHEYSDKAQQGVDSRLPGRGSDGRWILYFASSAESVGRYRSDDTRIRWPGIWRSPDPFSSSWHQRLVIASNKTSVHGAMSSLCISSPAVPRGLDGPMDLEQRRPLTGELQETCTPRPRPRKPGKSQEPSLAIFCPYPWASGAGAFAAYRSPRSIGEWPA